MRADKEREAGDGHDGTWVAHPGLVPVAREIFDRLMQSPNQLHKQRKENDHRAGSARPCRKARSPKPGLRNNVSVSLQYMAAWLDGNGCVPINNLMEDAATAEISRAQIWQWIHHPGGVLDDGRKVTAELFRKLLDEERERLQGALGARPMTRAPSTRPRACWMRSRSRRNFSTFLTLSAYRRLQ